MILEFLTFPQMFMSTILYTCKKGFYKNVKCFYVPCLE